MCRYLTTKGLYVRNIRVKTFVVEDAFGICTLPFHAENIEEASLEACKLMKINVLCPESELNPMASLESFRWFELEEYYVAKMPDHFRCWLVGKQSVQAFDALSCGLPLAYLEWGFGDGDRDMLEEIDKEVNALAANGAAPFTKELVAAKLSHIQLQRICDDLLSLIHRAIRAFIDLLLIQRETITQEYFAASLLKSSEIIHRGPKSHNAATSVTICVISLCTSLDISSKLIHFLNACSRPVRQFKNPKGKHFSAIPKMIPSTLSVDLIAKINYWKESESQFESLTQLRHDLTHSTAALEMEKIYIGFKTGEINELPLHYSSMPWRDCSENGQPLRYLGREYFTSEKIDIEWQLLSWIRAVVKYHIYVGEILYGFMESNTIDDVGVPLFTR